MTIRSFKKWGGALALALGAMTFPHPSLAQTAASYPNKPVKLLVSFPPGGFADLVGRGLAQALSQRWRQPVVVDNKPGGPAFSRPNSLPERHPTDTRCTLQPTGRL